MDKQKLHELIDLYSIRAIEIEEAINLGMVDNDFDNYMIRDVHRMVIKDLKSLLEEE